MTRCDFVAVPGGRLGMKCGSRDECRRYCSKHACRCHRKHAGEPRSMHRTHALGVISSRPGITRVICMVFMSFEVQQLVNAIRNESHYGKVHCGADCKRSMVSEGLVMRLYFVMPCNVGFKTPSACIGHNSGEHRWAST